MEKCVQKAYKNLNKKYLNNPDAQAAGADHSRCTSTILKNPPSPWLHPGLLRKFKNYKVKVYKKLTQIFQEVKKKCHKCHKGKITVYQFGKQD